MSAYLILKSVHIFTAILSISGFIIRGLWMIQSSPMLNKKWVKIVPHINDAILLATAIALVIITALYPGPVAWINAKIIALLVYIGLGMIALKRGKTKTVRIMAWLAAILTFLYIILVALSKNTYIAV